MHKPRSVTTRPVHPSKSSSVDHPSGSVVTRTAVSLEYASLRHSSHSPLGMYVVPSTGNLLVWDGVFFVHQGKTDIFERKLVINYPQGTMQMLS